MNPLTRPAVLVLLLAVALSSTGCQSWAQMKDERDALYRQNRALQDAKDQADAENARLRAEMAARATPPPAPAPAPTPMLGAGFEGISGIEVDRSTAGQVTVRVSGDVLFASGQNVLTSGAKKTLSEVAKVLQRDHAGQTIQVEGHTDSDPIKKSKWASNYALSEARAQAVADHLASQGIARSQMSIVGFGPDKPRGKDKSQNRRVEIVVIR